MFNTLVEDTKELDYITTYKFSKDHIELFFGSIRMHGGHNDNPNAQQIKGSYRELLCRIELQIGESGNCVPLENIAILTCSSALTFINNTTCSERFDDTEEEIRQLCKTPIEGVVEMEIASYVDEPNYKNHIVGYKYIPGNVVRHVTKSVKFVFCIGKR